jgi:hypothetical protein
MTFLVKGKRGAAIPAGAFLVIFTALLSILGGAFISVGTGNPVNKVTHTLLANKAFTIDSGRYFVSKALETATGDERKLLLQKGPEISSAVTGFLGNPIFQGQLDQLSNIAYAYYSTDSKVKQTVDVKPIVQLGLLGLESVDPQFSKLKKELDKIKPIKLQPQKSGPDIKQARQTFKLVIILLFLLVLLTLGLYLLFARSWVGILKFLGIALGAVGVVLIALYEVATAIIKHQAATASESLAREAIPIAAHPVIAPFFTLGVLELVIGIGFAICGFILAKRSGLKGVNVNS